MRRRWHYLVLAMAVAVLPNLAVAQHVRTLSKVGLLLLGTPDQDRAEWARAFREGMEALGWVEGRNVHYEYRFAADQEHTLLPLATELVATKVDVIVGFSTGATIAAHKATRSIPIVMAGAADPLAAEMVASLARPGGNVTGLSLMMREIAPKQLEMLKEVVPHLRRVGVLHAPVPVEVLILGDVKAAAPKLGLDLRDVVITAEADLPGQFQALTAVGAEALLVLPGSLTDALRGQISELAVLHQLPSIGLFRSAATAGLLLSYSPSLPKVHRRAAHYVDRILKGANPAELPIEQPTKLELVVNLQTAWALGLTIPPAILLRADEVIE